MSQPASFSLAGAEERGASRLEDQVYARLLDSIQRGRFALGQRLPSENGLARELGVSRPVLRTALARLREDGLIVSRQGAGSFVSSGAPQEGSGFGPLDSVEDIAAFFRFRRMIEAEAAAAAATRARPEDIEELRGYLREMDGLIESGTATQEPDLRFHGKIAELSDNRFLVESLSMLRPHLLFIGKFVRSLARAGYTGGKKQMSEEHGAIIGAMSKGDAEAARRAMEAHIDGSQRRVFKGGG